MRSFTRILLIVFCLGSFLASPFQVSVQVSQAEEEWKLTTQNNLLKIRLDGLPNNDFIGARIEFLDQESFFKNNMKVINTYVFNRDLIMKSSSSPEIKAEFRNEKQVIVRIILQNKEEFTFGNISTNQPVSINLKTKIVSSIKTNSIKKPNIIFILTDDLDEKLGTMEYTPKINQYIKDEGILWEDFFVADTLCCPSRSTISRGQFVHNHGVLTNGLPGGGFDTFYARGNENSTLATWLQEAGYDTGFFGKYLNGYPFKDDPLYIPPGWSVWNSPSAGNPYSDFNYVMNENGKAVVYGSNPEDYLTDVIRDHSIDFIQESSNEGKSFFVYLSPYVPHSPATPADRHSKLYPNLKTPHIRSFNEQDVSDKSSILRARKKLTSQQIKEMDKLFRKRVQSMQAVDEMVEKVVLTLQKLGELDNTYIFFTSDNGFHMGQHRLPSGKGTAYEEDINVPLYVRGPGIQKGKVISGFFGGNTDFAPTFAEIAGVKTPDFVDGRSLLPLLHGETPIWRNVFFIEFYPFARDKGEKPGNLRNVESVLEPLDMDEDMELTDDFSYIALRLPQAKYIEFKNGEKEYYDFTKDPYEMDNAIKTLNQTTIQALSQWANALHQAKGAELRKLEKKDISKIDNQLILIELWIGKNIAYVNHQPFNLEAAPMIKEGRTCVPARFISEALEASVLYDSKEQKITIQYQEIRITLHINKKEAFIEEIVNGKKNSRTVKLDVPPFILNGRTLVPIRFISEVFNLTVEWESTEQKITIKSNLELLTQRSVLFAARFCKNE